MTSRIIRAGMTQTINAYRDMPLRLKDLPLLKEKLQDIRKANVDHHLKLLHSAKTQGVAVVCFGELFTAPYFALTHDPMWVGLAEDAQEGPTVTAVKAEAKRLELIVIAPIYEQDPSGKRFNTAVVIDETGTVLGKYRKTHIPHGQNEQGEFLEGHYYDRSDGGNGLGVRNLSRNAHFPVWETAVGRIGVAICYDRHFEGVMWSLARSGAELIFSPAVTFGEKSQRMWQHEFQVDAARHNVFIGGSNRKGEEAPWGQPYFGETHFCSPNGKLPDMSNNPELIIGGIDLSTLAKPDPSGWNLRRDIRHDIYSPRP